MFGGRVGPWWVVGLVVVVMVTVKKINRVV
jgi:hypothetical protein